MLLLCTRDLPHTTQLPPRLLPAQYYGQVYVVSTRRYTYMDDGIGGGRGPVRRVAEPNTGVETRKRHTDRTVNAIRILAHAWVPKRE